MFAHHCIEDALFGVNGNFTVRVGDDPQALNAQAFPHTNAASGYVMTPDCPNCIADPLSNEDVSVDYAVVILDKPVSSELARPRPPPPIGACPASEFLGTSVGFGPASWGVIDDQNSCGNDQLIRRFAQTQGWVFGTADGWQRVAETASTFNVNPHEGSIYDAVWDFSVAFPCTYDDTVPGDSGGPMLDSQGHLCAVASAVRPVQYLNPFYGLSWNLQNVKAGMDAAGVQEFFSTIKNGLGVGPKDSKGNWLGTCPDYEQLCYQWGNCRLAEKDADLDGVWDSCDSCPRIWNPEQLSEDDDPDGNGHGAACDLCPGKQYDGGPGPTGNCNYEAELAIGYPGMSQPPVLNDPNSPTFAADKAKYLASFRPDACDWVTCPRQSRNAQGSEMPTPIVVCPSLDPPSQWPADCNCPMPGVLGCYWDASPNRIELRPQTTTDAAAEPEGQAIGETAKVGMRWCRCLSGAATLQERVACQASCTFNATSYDSNPDWVPIETAASGGFPATDLGLEHAMSVGELYNGTLGKAALWDWPALENQGPGYVTKQYYSHLGNQYGPVDLEARGVLLAKVVEADGQTVSPTSYSSFYSFAQTLQSGDAAAELVEVEPSPGIQVPPEIFIFMEDPLGVGDPFSVLATAPQNPYLWRVTPDGLDRVVEHSAGAVDLLVSFFEDLVHTGELAFIPAIENPVNHSGLVPPGETVLRGIGFDLARGRAAYALEALSGDALPGITELGECTGECELDLVGSEGLMLSSWMNMLLVLGGTEDGSIWGEPKSHAWFFDVEENRGSFVELPSDGRPGVMLGLTYRRQDFFAYLVDRQGETTSMRRYLPRSAEIEVLAEFPNLWNDYERGWLVVGETGDIVFAASVPPIDDGTVALCHGTGSDAETVYTYEPSEISEHLAHGDPVGDCARIGDDVAPHRAVLARFTVDADGNLVFMGKKNLYTPILGMPLVSSRAIAFPVANGDDARLRVVVHDELVIGPPGETPTIL